MSEIDYKELKSDLDQKKIHRIYFLCGEEKYLIDNFLIKIKQKVLGSKYSDFDFKSFEFENFNLENFGEAIEMPPVQTRYKCVILKNLNVYEITDEIYDGFLKILKDIPKYTVLIISQASGKGSIKIKNLKNFVEKNGCIVRFSSKDIPIDRQLILWSKNFGKILEKDSVNFLIKRCGENLSVLNAEIKKICEFEKNEIISKETIEKITIQAKIANMFDINKALESRNIKKALFILDILLEQGEQPIAILAVISSRYVDIARVSAAIASGEDKDIVKDFFDYKKKEFRLKNAFNVAKKINMEDIKKYLKILLNGDCALKSTTLSPKLILSEVICKLGIL